MKKVLIAYGLRRNCTIMEVNLNMNPLGRNGAQALLRHQVEPHFRLNSIVYFRCNSFVV